MELWLSSAFKSLIEEEDFVDCRVIVESQAFPCHKVMLGVASDFFKRSFMPGLEGTETGELHLENVSADTFKKFRWLQQRVDRKADGVCPHVDDSIA
ncbi:hypothetical protein M5D96_014065 [Drosophila gunungcola]|uniref:BTB domain-containing protein n=1 Tax=Drosophila gunungcola TaxID=103775 RepID=A0A9Q0BIH8_9MUSC|nr:hypothetical protein M5D96_014065 [Drosophila gunungcola]